MFGVCDVTFFADVPGEYLTIFSAVYDPEPVSDAFDFEVGFVDVPDGWFRIFSSRNLFFCGEYPLANGFVAYSYIEYFFQNLRDSPQRCRESRHRVEFNCEANDVTEYSSSGQVACPDETKTASSTLVTLDASFVFSITVEVLSSALLAPGNKRTFFIAKAMQVCL